MRNRKEKSSLDTHRLTLSDLFILIGRRFEVTRSFSLSDSVRPAYRIEYKSCLENHILVHGTDIPLTVICIHS